MKKIYFTLAAVLLAFNVQAFDVTDGLKQVSATADDAAQKVETAKGSRRPGQGRRRSPSSPRSVSRPE